MKILVISKPIYEYILPLVEFPNDGDVFNINTAVNTMTNSGTLTAITLAKYGADVVYNGVVGEDDVSKKIKAILEDNKVSTDYVETNYTEKSNVSYKIYNTKTNKFTTINEVGSKAALTKYKYDFIPDVIIMDDKDYNANLAALNNFPKATFIYMSEKYTKESSVFCNKCKYIISNLKFASEATGVVEGLNKEKNLVQLFQKFIDLHNANLIIKLDNFDMLYCINDEVRLIKNINKSITNKDNVYYSVLAYFLTQNMDIETAIKLTNKAMLSSASELDMIKDIPDYTVIEGILKEYNELKQTMVTETVQGTGQVSEVGQNNESVSTVTATQNNAQVQGTQQVQNVQAQNTAPTQNVVTPQSVQQQNTVTVNSANTQVVNNSSVVNSGVNQNVANQNQIQGNPGVNNENV